jgi:hypothetical protein
MDEIGAAFPLPLRGIVITGSVIDTAVICLFSYFSLAEMVHAHVLSDHDPSRLSRYKYHVSLERLAESNSSLYANDSNFQVDDFDQYKCFHWFLSSLREIESKYAHQFHSNHMEEKYCFATFACYCIHRHHSYSSCTTYFATDSATNDKI